MKPIPPKNNGRGTTLQLNNRFERHSYETEPEATDHAIEGVGRTEFTEIFPKGILNKIDSPDIGFNWGMNPYQGCEHGCIYCYARTTHEYWGFNAGLDFEKQILIKKQAPELLRQKLGSKSWKGETIMLSGNTDCYQPAERKLKITRDLIRVCLDFKQSLAIITKNALITRDVDLLRDMARQDLVGVSLSITSSDEHVRRVLEPRTSSYTAKLKAIETLRQAGIPVSVMMAPVIPGLTDREILKIAKDVSQAGALNLYYTLVRLNGPIALLFENWLAEHLPDSKERILKLIKECHGGRMGNSKFGERMRGKGNIADIIHQQFELARTRYDLKGPRTVLNTSLFRKRPDQLSLF
ncbi:MAG: PA0069 family radical SAM protein [Flavobacteriales bacterium]|nr:PA0069 family radical SAM protein [Flavobacteriales bacterium]